jgi:hypothetical protein
MPAVQNVTLLTDEIAEFLATCPSREGFLSYRPSQQVQQRAKELLHKNKDGSITKYEQRELDQYEHAEMLMRLVKARLRSRNASQR